MPSNAAAAFAGASSSSAGATGTAGAQGAGAAGAADGAGAAAGTAGAAGAAGGAAANGAWYDAFENPEVKTWTAAKGFKDPAAVAESAYNLEKLIGFDKAGRTLVVPKDDATPDEMRAFHAKLGVPETPDGYKLPLPETADPKLAATLQGWMHKAGVTPRAAETLTKEFVAYSAEQQRAAEGEMIAASDKAFADQTTAWGAKADENLELGKRFAAQVLPAEITLDSGAKVSRQQFLESVFNATGATRVFLEMFAKAGGGLGEHKIAGGGDNPAMGLSPQAAQARIQALRTDPEWTKAYLGGDRAKLEEMTRLMAIANGAPGG
jgi:hypothetical protein